MECDLQARGGQTADRGHLLVYIKIDLPPLYDQKLFVNQHFWINLPFRRSFHLDEGN